MTYKNDKVASFVKSILKKLHIKVKKKTEDLYIQIVKFIIVGGIATIIDWSVYYVLYNFLNINPLIANILSFTVSVVYNYIASVRWIFNVNENNSKQKMFIVFIVFSVIGLILTELLIYLGVDIMSIDALLVKIIATAIVMVFNFITRKIFLE